MSGLLYKRLPNRTYLFGPVTWSGLRRLIFIYSIIFSLGALFLFCLKSDYLGLLGLGLMIPGGGFLVHADWSTWMGFLHYGAVFLGALSVLAGCFIWFATGNVLLPPIAWAFFIVLPFLYVDLTDDSLRDARMQAVMIVFSFFAFTILACAHYKRSGVRKRDDLNAYLNSLPAETQFLSPAVVGQKNHELSPADLKRINFIYDRALQPENEFNGFDWLDQFQTAAVRYQINFLGYALSMAQAKFLPALSGCIDQAQRCLIQKQTDYKIWQYWTIENLWGNLRYDPDPIKRDNIMFTGFCATQMMMYHRASGGSEYNSIGSFSLKHPSGQVYNYSLPSLVDRLAEEFSRSQYTLMPCEPNWIYPLCNSIGASALRAHSPNVWDKISSDFEKSLEEEFIDLSGQIVACRSSYSGLGFPMMVNPHY